MLSQTKDLAESDEDLAQRAGLGDESAFAELYERHSRGIYDHAARLLGDRDAAADVTQATFAKALETLLQRRAIRQVRAWLYAIARNKAIDELRDRKRLAPVGEIDERAHPLYWGGAASSSAGDPESAVIDKEVAELVWKAAAALNPQDYALLDLHVRHGFASEELAESLNLRKGAVYTRLTRLKQALERSVTSEVLMRRGRKECPRLDELLNAMGAIELTPEVGKAIDRHVRDCSICAENKRRFVSPVEIFAGLTPIAVTSKAEFRDDTYDSRDPQVPSSGSLDGSRHLGALLRTPAILAAGGAVTAAAVLIVLTLVVGSSGNTVALQDPNDVHSTSHESGVPSEDDTIVMRWTPLNGAAGYSLEWSTDPDALPDAIADLDGGEAGTASAPLGAGSWYFHLRTNWDEGWTHTVHVGPFVIEEPRITGSQRDEKEEPEARRDAPPKGDKDSPDPSPTASPTAIAAASPDPEPATDTEPDPEPTDDTPPKAPTIVAAPVSLSRDPNPTWGFTGESKARFECELTGPGGTSYSGSCRSPRSFGLAGTGDGRYLFTVLQIDTEGNRSERARDSFVLDTTAPPAPDITSGPGEVTEDPKPVWSFRGEPGGSFACSLSGPSAIPYRTCSSPWSFDLSAAPNGDYSFRVKQSDDAGNTSKAATWSFLLRRQPD